MSLFKMPKAVKSRLDWMKRIFLREWHNDRKKINPMKQEEVITPKSVWGLGIGNLRINNWALLVKWLWRSGDEREAPWRKIVVSMGRMVGVGFLRK